MKSSAGTRGSGIFLASSHAHATRSLPLICYSRAFASWTSSKNRDCSQPNVRLEGTEAIGHYSRIKVMGALQRIFRDMKLDISEQCLFFVGGRECSKRCICNFRELNFKTDILMCESYIKYFKFIYLFHFLT